MNKKIVVFSFVLAFFTVHPINKMCGEDCLASALVIAFLFSFFNLSIYKFFIGDAFDIPSGVNGIIKSKEKCKTNFDKVHRMFWFIVILGMNIGVIYIIFQQSWIFN